MIPSETIAEVRERTDIVAILAESIPSLKRNGRRFVGLCPFHKEKTPSFNVNPDSGFFHCFGCKESGSVIDFVMKHEGLTFPEAVRALAERLGIEVKDERAPQTDEGRQRKQKDDLYAVNALAASFFETQLREHPERQLALDELARRDLTPSWAQTAAAPPGAQAVDDALQAFRIGYAPARWDALVAFLRAQGVSPVVAETVGLLVPRASGGHFDRFFNRLMFAVVDVQGRVVGFSGRILPDPPNAKKSEQKPAKYINSPESPIYTKGNTLFGIHQARAAIRQDEVAIVVEGNFDVVSLHARGLTNVIAPLGTAFTPDQAKLLRRFSENVVFLFDGDAAGRKAARAAREPSRLAGLRARVAVLPEKIDPDELARTKGIASVREVAGRAKGMLEYLIDAALDETFSSADAHERAARLAEVSKLIAEEDDPIVRSLSKSYADKLAGRLDLVRSPDAFRALEAAVKKALASMPASRGATGPDPKSARVAARPPGLHERKAMVGALIEYPALLEDVEVSQVLDLLEGLSAQVVVGLVRAWHVPSPRNTGINREQFDGREEGAENTQVGATRTEPSSRGEKRLDVPLFLAQIPETIHPFASERLAAPQHETIEIAKQAVLDNAHKLRRTLGLQETTDFAREEERVAGNWEAETNLAREASNRARLRHGLK